MERDGKRILRKAATAYAERGNGFSRKAPLHLLLHDEGDTLLNNSGSIFEFLDEIRHSNISEEDIQRRVVGFLQKKARETNTPYSGHFELTPLCNLNCKMCYVHLDGVQMRSRKLLTVDQWQDIMQQAIDAGMAKATLSGGECLTYPGFDEVFLFLKTRGIPTTILTNGVLLNDDRIHFFTEHKPRKIQISLYGSSDDVYEKVTGVRAFSTVRDNLVKAKAANLPLKISITPSRYLYPDIKDVIRLAKGLEIPYAINMGLMTPRPETGRDEISHDIGIDDYIELIKYNRSENNRVPEPRETKPIPDRKDAAYTEGLLKCGAGRSTFSISWEGIMNPCTQMINVAANPLQEGFLNAWKAINNGVRTYPRFKECDECEYSHACDFCAAENEKLGSKYQLNHMWCERTWKMVENGLRIPDPQCD